MSCSSKALRQNKSHLSQSVSHATDELAQLYLIEELGIPAEAIKDAGKNLIGFFEILHNIDQRLNNSETTA